MKRNLLILSLVIAFLTGCAGMQLKSDTSEIAVDLSASTIGYLVGQNNLDKIPEWTTWIDKVLAFEQGDTVLSYETVLAEAFSLVVDSPFLEMQFKKLIRLFEFPELQPPELAFLTSDYIKYVKIVASGFNDGLMAAKAEATQ